ncbi:MAG: GNAT family N-acetyltransferase [Afipia sp. 62-7]|nr:MAG: GNAT family N-acetyltransferase [Afipia sp. 62-7]
MSGYFMLRPYRASDEDAAIDLWQRTWQLAYPAIDFAQRRDAWRVRWREDLVPAARIMVALRGGTMIGFVTIDTGGYLDQLVVAPEEWGSDLGDTWIGKAKAVSPNGVTLLVNTDNSRAIRFYERNDFIRTHEDVNPVSGRKVYGMKWVP